ncbi:MAG: cache domain-containing protein [Syntrophales bacterium]
MKKISIAVLAFIFLMTGLSYAAEKGSAKEAQAMVKKAAAYWKENGKDKAFAAFDNPKGQFVDRDLYVYVIDMTRNAMVVSHGTNHKLIGKELIGLKDTDGKQFLKEIVDIAKAKGSGWVDYKWTNPVSKKVESKTAYFEKFSNFVIVCGAYK